MSIFAGYFAARRRKQALRDLRALSPETLRDIGIDPGGIEAFVSAAFDDRAASEAASRQGARPASGCFSTGAWPYPSAG